MGPVPECLKRDGGFRRWNETLKRESRTSSSDRCPPEPTSSGIFGAVRARTEEELADILLYLVRFADQAGIDLHAAALRKLERNAEKYPAEKFRGSDRRYDE